MGYDADSNWGTWNDLWKFNGANWIWVSGSEIRNQSGGVYGDKGTANPDNIPGGRSRSVSWIDSDGNLWLFGGLGLDANSNMGRLNDLWKFDGTGWTWVSGNDIANQLGVYGIIGEADPANIPGARHSSVSWIDSSGNLWLFGGYEDSTAEGIIDLNDLWKFDGTNWTWVSGSEIRNQLGGVYGDKGTADPDNIPGGRSESISWIDSSDNLWLFGGWGFDADGKYGCLNDLWKF